MQQYPAKADCSLKKCSADVAHPPTLGVRPAQSHPQAWLGLCAVSLPYPAAKARIRANRVRYRRPRKETATPVGILATQYFRATGAKNRKKAEILFGDGGSRPQDRPGNGPIRKH